MEDSSVVPEEAASSLLTLREKAWFEHATTDPTWLTSLSRAYLAPGLQASVIQTHLQQTHSHHQLLVGAFLRGHVPSHELPSSSELVPRSALGDESVSPCTVKAAAGMLQSKKAPSSPMHVEATCEQLQASCEQLSISVPTAEDPPPPHPSPKLCGKVALPLPPKPPSPTPSASFEWIECMPRSAATDRTGAVPSTWSGLRSAGLQVRIDLHPLLLYWARQRQWLWHKKWILPTITVTLERTAVNERVPAGTTEPLYVMITAGTLAADGSVLDDAGPGGVRLRMLELGPSGKVEVSFSRLQLLQTSHNLGDALVHLGVSVLGSARSTADQPWHPSLHSMEPALQPIVSFRSPGIHVDARKRSPRERPTAAGDDIRLAQRPVLGTLRTT